MQQTNNFKIAIVAIIAKIANIANIAKYHPTMNSSPDFARPKTGYRSLYCFQKSEAIYDLTYLFLNSHIDKRDRTYDQMLQAARSGKQNIVEGRSDAASSAEMEIKLYGVARGSLEELLNDYLDFMRTRQITIWNQGHPRLRALIATCRCHNDTQYYMQLAPRLNDEEFTNLLLTIIRQCVAMISKMIDLVKQDFIKNGGIKEQMYRARLSYRNNETEHRN